MAGDAAKRQGLSVEDETLLGIDEEFAEAIGFGDLIDRLIVDIGPCDDFV